MPFAEDREIRPAAAQRSREELQEVFELMKSRNWITEQMVEATMHHYHCSRDEALAKLIPADALEHALA